MSGKVPLSKYFPYRYQLAPYSLLNIELLLHTNRESHIIVKISNAKINRASHQSFKKLRQAIS